MAGRRRRIPEHLTATLSDDGTKLRYEFTAQQLFSDLGLNRVNDRTLADLRFINSKAFSLVMIYKAYQSLLKRDQVAGRDPSGNHWVFLSDLEPEATRMFKQYSS